MRWALCRQYSGLSALPGGGLRERTVQDYLRRLQSLKRRLYSEFRWLEGRDLCEIMGKLGHYHYNKKKFILLGENRNLYTFLIKDEFNPFTVYRWLLLERVPEDIKYQKKENYRNVRRLV